MIEKVAVGAAEFTGLTAAIAFLDAAVKAADVRMTGYEITGNGLVTVKLSGNVSAVQAAMDAGLLAAQPIGRAAGHLILARPHEDVGKILYSRDNKIRRSPEPEEESPAAQNVPPESSVESEALSPQPEEEASPGTVGLSETEEIPEPIAQVRQEPEQAACNLCGDPKCPRTKGQPRRDCIHYKDGETFKGNR
ncbi:BMC domain-containing protein [Caproiciproducens sp.]